MNDNVFPQIMNITNYVDVPATTQDNLDEVDAAVDGINIPFDLIFVGSLFGMFVLSLISAARTDPLTNTKLLYTVFIWGAVMGIMIYFASDIISYFFTNYIIAVFDYPMVMTEKIIDNIGIVFFFWWLSMLAANQIQRYMPEELVE
jgi:hypothetical protein